MSNPPPLLLVIGGAHVDRLARLRSSHQDQTSNPVSMTEEIGGGAFNAGRAAKRLGFEVAILSARGGDTAGALVEEAILTAGLSDHSSVHLDRATPSYTAILEPDGKLVTAIADMDLYETAVARSFKRAPVQKTANLAQAFLCDANLNALGLLSVFTEVAQGKPVFALAVSASKVLRYQRLLPYISCLFMNCFEAAALTGLPSTTSPDGLAKALKDMKLFRAVISNGAGPCTFLEGETIFQLTPPPVNVVDVTGAGDCLAGTIVTAMLLGSSFNRAAQLGMAAATLTVSRFGPSPHISFAEIEKLANSHEWASQ